MSYSHFKMDAAAAAKDLVTVRDFIRYAVSSFTSADLYFGHGLFNAWDEAVFLVLETLKLPVTQLEPYLDARLTAPERKMLAKLIAERVTTRKPVPYLTRRTYLQGASFYVDERVIVPRSYIAELIYSDLFTGDSPTLIEDPHAVTSVLDLCTGSGCLAILAAYAFPNASVDAVDLSPKALEVAKINVAEHKMESRVSLYQGNLFSPLKGKTYDLILTNPPYVEADAMAELPPEYLHEPEMALAGGGQDGLDIVRQILKEAPDHLTPDGGILCEFGFGRETLEKDYPRLPFLWLDTAESSGEVFWLTRAQMV